MGSGVSSEKGSGVSSEKKTLVPVIVIDCSNDPEFAAALQASELQAKEEEDAQKAEQLEIDVSL